MAYIVEDITPKGVATLKNSSRNILKEKYNRQQVKPYNVSGEKLPASEEKSVALDEVIVSDKKPAILDDNPSPFENKSSAAADENQDVAEENNFVVNHWQRLPNEVIEKILQLAIESSGYSFPGHVCETYQTLIAT